MTPDTLWRRRAMDYALMGSPLTPTPQDIAFLEAAAARQADEVGRPIHALILGVTPAIAGMHWPEETRLTAVDKSETMVQALWRTPAGVDARVEKADWLDLPLADGSIDLATCDGGFTLFGFPGGHAGLARELSRVLAPSGRAALRMFVIPDDIDTPGAVFDRFEAGGFTGFHAFKWRLVMAMQRDETQGAAVADVFAAYEARRAASSAFRDALSAFDPAVVATMDAYRGLEQRHHFPRLSSLERAFAGSLKLEAVHTPDYELGDRSPTLIWTKSG